MTSKESLDTEILKTTLPDGRVLSISRRKESFMSYYLSICEIDEVTKKLRFGYGRLEGYQKITRKESSFKPYPEGTVKDELLREFAFAFAPVFLAKPNIPVSEFGELIPYMRKVA